MFHAAEREIEKLERQLQVTNRLFPCQLTAHYKLSCGISIRFASYLNMSLRLEQTLFL